MSLLSGLLPALSDLWERLLSQPDDEDNKQPTPPPVVQADPYIENLRKIVDDYKSTAKWILAVYAAIAALLLAGSQLSTIGRLGAPATWEEHRLLVAGGAAALGIFFAGIVVLSAVRVLQTGSASLKKIERDEREANGQKRWDAARQQWRRRVSHDLVWAYETDFLDRYSSGSHKVKIFRATLIDRNEKNINPPPGFEEADQIKNRQLLEAMYREQDRLLWIVRAFKVRRALQQAVVAMFICGTAVAAAIIAFSWAANPPSQHAAIAEAVPGLAAVSFSSAEAQRMSALLGETCVESPVAVILLEPTNASNTSFEVVSIPNDRCNSTRFVAGEDGVGTIDAAISE